jgi:hypothetical protein
MTLANGDIESLFDHYLAHGCPCRFPRFRATVGRNLKEIGAWDWGVIDILPLLTVFDRRVRLVEVTSEALCARGRCALCGASVVRYAIPVFRDSFLEGATITSGSLGDLGAGVQGPLPICGGVFHAGPGPVARHERERIEQAYPRFNVQDWLEFMCALAS